MIIRNNQETRNSYRSLSNRKHTLVPVSRNSSDRFTEVANQSRFDAEKKSERYKCDTKTEPN